jgi:hypothetical protein
MAPPPSFINPSFTQETGITPPKHIIAEVMADPGLLRGDCTRSEETAPYYPQTANLICIYLYQIHTTAVKGNVCRKPVRTLKTVPVETARSAVRPSPPVVPRLFIFPDTLPAPFVERLTNAAGTMGIVLRPRPDYPFSLF